MKKKKLLIQIGKSGGTTSLNICLSKSIDEHIT